MIRISCIFACCLVIAVTIQGLSGFEERIYKGSVATRGQFPWATYLNITSTNGEHSVCTGTLISDKYVVTAAHCVENAEEVIVYLGMTRSDDQNGTMRYVVEKDSISIYPTWNSTTGEDDLALLKLQPNVDLWKYEWVDFIRLPERSSSSIYEKKIVQAQGWGVYNRRDQEKASVDLRFANVEVMPKTQCKKYFGRLFGSAYPITDGMICVMRLHRRGPCNMDDGGPITLNNTQGDPMMIGLDSYNLGACGNPGPAVYTYLGYAPYLDWIHKIGGIGSLGHMDFPITRSPNAD